jgi:hypothetical protein
VYAIFSCGSSLLFSELCYSGVVLFLGCRSWAMLFKSTHERHGSGGRCREKDEKGCFFALVARSSVYALSETWDSLSVVLLRHTDMYNILVMIIREPADPSYMKELSK